MEQPDQLAWLVVSALVSWMHRPSSLVSGPAGTRSGALGHCCPYVVKESTVFSLGLRGSRPGRWGQLLLHPGVCGHPQAAVATLGPASQPAFQVLALAHSSVSLCPVSRFVRPG